ncbi:Jacalin-related lectin 33 [Carex littledalei]|uniref:Jacalin-related lectin 33 n=1 Tax=Carex littledalei TaxID=544730 RepID=A0A833QUQ4_9POAL|nr:Jacalin-related lectin 33 [Carex littledalei]
MARDIHIKLASVGLNEQGTPWNDGGHQKIEKIVIGYTPSFISSIEVVYSDGGDDTRVLAPRHGANSSSLIKMMTITEPITRIHGTYCSYTGITSLELSSRRGTYCTINNDGNANANANANASSFTFDSDSGFTGFHGRADDFQLKALGVYVNSTAKSRLRPNPERDCSVL